MKLSNTQKEILANIKGKLRRGDANSIAKITSKSLNYVGMVLNPDSDHYNEYIVTEAVRIITEREQSTQKLLETIAAA